MLIDAAHPEETRVVVVDGTRLEDFDFETAARKPLKGNIYLAKVIRIEPSLQAAFVEYGGNRHGFLAFSEIHADYFQIPVADRERLIAEQQRQAREADEEHEHRRRDRVDRTDIEEARAERQQETIEAIEAGTGEVPQAAPPSEPAPEAAPMEATAEPAPEAAHQLEQVPALEPAAQPAVIEVANDRIDGPVAEVAEVTPVEGAEPVTGEHLAANDVAANDVAANDAAPADPSEAPQPEVSVETLGGDDAGEERETRERRRRTPIRHYKIQEVIKRRQILLVQVVKEERGNKGAALTTFLSLAGRYCVLMPNAGRGGGISRKISNPSDRKRMKEMLAELEVPQGQGVILRTAGLERSNLDIKRDYEYLTRLWDSIREITMRSTAPALIYEEGDLIKRSLRDVYDTDIAEVLVEGEAGYQAASEFMRQLVPHESAKVHPYKEQIPLFHRYQVESQFDAMHSPVVQLRSGGYVVINPTEALVAIDVNSGRSTRERNIEETALRTNIEAAEEIARQVRLRDLAGLIVIDFIDMEETRHQRQVEHKVKDAMRNDRARIQIGRISAFGLLEMSRQRLRPSLLEHSTEVCPHCAGTGRVRSIESAALHAMRAIEEEGVRRRASEIAVSVPPNVALYMLNQKRQALSEIEARYGFTVLIEADEELHAADCEIERVRSRRDDHRPAQELARASYDEVSSEGDETSDAEPDTADGGERAPREGDAEGRDGDGRGRRRRRRRRRGGRREDGEERSGDRPWAASGNGADVPAGEERSAGPEGDEANYVEQEDEPTGEGHGEGHGEGRAEANGDGAERHGGERHEGGDRNDGDRRRRRGRRGGRRRRRENGDGEMRSHGDEQAPREGSWNEHGGEPARESTNGHEGFAGEPVTDAHHEAPAMAAAPIEAAPEPRHEPRTEPRPEPRYVAPPEPVAAAPEPEPTPPPPPVVPTISADTPPEKPKRGWWRR
jgi:ribonuclease E